MDVVAWVADVYWGDAMKPIVRGFKSLTDFKGRDHRGQFWPYAVAIFAAAVVAAIAACAPSELKAFNQTLAFAEANPDKATIYRSSTKVNVVIHDPTGMPPMDFNGLIVPMSLVLLVVALLMAAAVTRRLHDRGLSGPWALIPAGLYGVGLTLWGRMMSSMFTEVSAVDNGAFMISFMLNFLVMMLAQMSMVVLLIVLAIKGKTGPNRYGPEPV